MAKSHSKPPPKRYPFPRAQTRPITGPEYVPGMTHQEAKDAWFAYLRIVSQIRPMNLPPGNAD